MSWSTSDRSSRLPPDWEKRRKKVLKRDAYSCQAIDLKAGRKCLDPATEVDHIARGDNHELDNLQSICSSCHMKKTQKEASEARKIRKDQISSSHRRRELPHPGDL